MADDKTPIEQALDVLVYAPLGFVFSATELIPKLAEKGRAQMGMAKMVGQFAVQQGQTEAGKVIDRASKQAMSTLEQLAGLRSNDAPSTNGNGNGHGPASAPAPTAQVIDLPVAPTSGPEAATLAIPDYDSLSASQVLPRLNGLDADELEAVRSYESAHRGRKTILNRVTQLQA